MKCQLCNKEATTSATGFFKFYFCGMFSSSGFLKFYLCDEHIMKSLKKRPEMRVECLKSDDVLIMEGLIDEKEIELLIMGD